MARLAHSALALVFTVVAAQPILATEVYVPYAVNTNDDGVRQRTEVLLTNTQPSLAQSVTLRWLPSDGGRSRAVSQVYDLAPGQTVEVANLVHPGRRGMIAIDPPLGVAVSARLVVDAPGAGRQVTKLPVIDPESFAPAQSRIVLQGLENVTGQRASRVGIVNTGSERATCEATLQGTDAVGPAATQQFDISPRSQILGEDVFSLFGGHRPATAYASISCDREFFSYGVVEDRIEGSVELLEPAYDSVVDAALIETKHSLTGSPNSIFFRLPGEYLVSSKYNTNWQYDMRFGTTRTFKKIKIDFDVFVKGWDTRGPITCDGKTWKRTYHCLFWLNNGSKWSNMLGYMNLISNKGQTRMEINSPIYVRNNKSPMPSSGSTYHVHYEFDGASKTLWYKITKNGNTVVQNSWGHGKSSYSTSYMRIQFGTQTSCGPEAATYGWKFSNFVAEYVQ